MDKDETNRDRIRRLLLEPMGFRFPKKTDPVEGRKLLDRIADDLGYMADARLGALRDLLRTKGQGSDRNFWPDHATFVNFAELIQPRPIEELPALRSWFGSIEGPRAIADGTLVETWEYLAARKVPPALPQARKLILEKAAANATRLTIIEERRRVGLGIAEDDIGWERWYRARRADCEAIVARERAARGKDNGEGFAA